MSRRVLVVVTSLVGADEIESTVASRFDEEGADVRVVAPSFDETGEDADPLLEIRDTLREFPADELVLVTRPEEDTTWLERGTGDEANARLDLPVTHIVVS